MKTENPNRRKRVGHDAEKKRGVLWLTPFIVVPFRESGLVGLDNRRSPLPSIVAPLTVPCRRAACSSNKQSGFVGLGQNKKLIFVERMSV
ncbi:uncharacterized protein G2W53_007878 [Senna tora]|uniref:Uncharacterized protein n=1 Tax=Senna tora TaxID=362788 RepID=A0A835CE45_9FABA|nr:uncharacterized protein G2W53_007878 [Senna tora]